MGNLKPGATYIYERADGVTYAREFGSSERSVVGYDYSQEYGSTYESIQDSKFWGELRREARTNVALQHALDRAIMIYRLSKDKPL